VIPSVTKTQSAGPVSCLNKMLHNTIVTRASSSANLPSLLQTKITDQMMPRRLTTVQFNYGTNLINTTGCLNETAIHKTEISVIIPHYAETSISMELVLAETNTNYKSVVQLPL